MIGQHIISLSTVLGCLAFSSVCGFEHLQRANTKNSVSLSDSLYYIIITFSTVGYGDITPDTWPSKFFMAVMIIVALIVIPTQLEHLASLWFERQNLGASYSSHRSMHERHIVVCTTALSYDIIVDFLNEFYAHRKNQVYSEFSANLFLTVFFTNLNYPPVNTRSSLVLFRDRHSVKESPAYTVVEAAGVLHTWISAARQRPGESQGRPGQGGVHHTFSRH